MPVDKKKKAKAGSLGTGHMSKREKHSFGVRKLKGFPKAQAAARAKIVKKNKPKKK